MNKIPILNLHSRAQTQTHFCDVVIEDEGVFLEKKEGHGRSAQYRKIPWEDVVYQVEAARRGKAV